MTRLTRKDLKRWKSIASNYKCGYCEYKNLPYDEKQKFIELGYNCGVYGWNWTLYYNAEDDLLICDGYRNFQKER